MLAADASPASAAWTLTHASERLCFQAVWNTPRRVRSLLVKVASGCGRGWWVLVPVLAMLFTLAAGRGWPVRFGPDFPGVDGDRTHPATAATLSVYSPDTRTMQMRVNLFVAEPGELPPLQVSLTHDGAVDAWATATRLDGQSGLQAEVPLRLTRGSSTIRLTVGSPGTEPTAFLVTAVRVTQALFNAGNGRFCLALAAVAASAILAARALGAGGLDQFCFAPLIGFLLVTSTATVLSPWHLLMDNAWAGALVGLSLGLGAWSLRRLARHPPPAPMAANVLRPWEAFVLLAVACPAFAMHILQPVAKWDDLMYHAPRAVYWMQNASALPFVSYDDRLSVFPFGGDALFACGTILAGAEQPGKFLGGLSLPLTLFALFALLKNARVPPGVALALTLVFATTPRVTNSATEIKPDLWLVLLGIIALHAVLAARRGDSAVSRRVLACLAAAAVGAAFGIKWTAVPLLGLLPFAGGRRDGRWRPAQYLLPAAALVAALALGGAGPILLFNLKNSHHPFGPAEMRRVHQPDPGVHPVMVQLKRLPFLLFRLPCLPDAELRNALTRWEQAAADALGATEVLPPEKDSVAWPGRFVPGVEPVDDRFSLGWTFVLAGMAGGLWRCVRGRSRVGQGDFLLVSALWVVFFVAVVTQTRWQVNAQVPERFLLPAYAFGLIAASWPASGLLGGRRTAVGLWGAVVVLHAVPYGVACLDTFRYGEERGWRASENARTKLEIDDVAHRLPPGRTVLLLADQGSRNYPLFRAREGFANRVLPWGKAAYEPAAFDRAVRRPGVDTVVIAPADALDISWDPPMDARPFVQDMDSRPEFSRLPGTGKIVVYLRRGLEEAPSTPAPST